VASLTALQCPKPRQFGVLTRVRASFGWVALGVGWVYCFLSRREGDSEELVTAGGQIPEI
jgi:hypothetical protein